MVERESFVELPRRVSRHNLSIVLSAFLLGEGHFSDSDGFDSKAFAAFQGINNLVAFAAE